MEEVRQEADTPVLFEQLNWLGKSEAFYNDARDLTTRSLQRTDPSLQVAYIQATAASTCATMAQYCLARHEYELAGKPKTTLTSPPEAEGTGDEEDTNPAPEAAEPLRFPGGSVGERVAGGTAGNVREAE